MGDESVTIVSRCELSLPVLTKVPAYILINDKPEMCIKP